MNLDDESLLSAYLDDELDSADRLTVEWSIESNLPLAEQFRSIDQARAAVSSLARPELPRDLAADVLARLRVNRRREQLGKLARPARFIAAFSGFAGIAASLIFAIILLNQSLHPTAQPVQIAHHIVPENRTHLPLPDLAIASPAQPQDRVSSIEPFVPAVIVSKPKSAKSLPLDETRERETRRAITGMLEQPHVRRIVIVTDVIDASDKVKQLIHQDGRLNPEFGRISICQEIVIDAERPEAVEVFAVPMDERDRRSFVGQLARAFPDLVEENEETRPELVTQLTEVGQVALFRGTEAAPLVDPPHELRPFIAEKAEIPPPHIVETDAQPSVPKSPKDAIGTRKGEMPRRSDGAKADSMAAHPPTDLKPGDRVTVLVWVVTRPSRRL